jgi:CBS domain-containing protein
MVKENIGSLMVFDESNEVVGIITERDFLKSAIKYDTYEVKIKEIMTKKEKIKFVTPKDNINTVISIMREFQIRHVPVFENNQIKGIVSIKDVLRIMYNDSKHQIERLQKFIQGWIGNKQNQKK